MGRGRRRGRRGGRRGGRRRESQVMRLLRHQYDLEYWKLYFDYEKQLIARTKRPPRAAPAASPVLLREVRRAEAAPVPAPPPAPIDITNIVEIETNIHTLDDLLHFIEHVDMSKRYAFSKQKLKAVEPALRELRAIVGQEKIKTDITHQILYFLQSPRLSSMNHTVITGDSGTGKTTIAQILGKIYHGLLN